MWIGGGGSGGSGKYDCAHQTALYTRNRNCLPESSLVQRVSFLGACCSQGRVYLYGEFVHFVLLNI